MAAIGLTSALGIVAFAWPLFADAGSQITQGPDGPWLFALLVPLLLAVVLAEIAEGGLDAKAVALLGVLTALGAALRPLSGGVTGFQPMFVVIILAGRVFGPGFGFVLGSTSMLASALLTGGVGPWLPFQMLAAAWLGLGAGCYPAVAVGGRYLCSPRTAWSALCSTASFSTCGSGRSSWPLARFRTSPARPFSTTWADFSPSVW